MLKGLKEDPSRIGIFKDYLVENNYYDLAQQIQLERIEGGIQYPTLIKFDIQGIGILISKFKNQYNYLYNYFHPFPLGEYKLETVDLLTRLVAFIHLPELKLKSGIIVPIDNRKIYINKEGVILTENSYRNLVSIIDLSVRNMRITVLDI